MSHAEIDRFVAALRNDPKLIEIYGAASDAAGLAALLRTNGYDVTNAETEKCLRECQTLSEEELDQVAGGSSAAEWMAKYDRYGIAGALFTLGRIKGISLP